METEIGEEGSLASGGVDEIGECEFGEGKTVGPPFLVVRRVSVDVGFESLIWGSVSPSV